MPYKKGDKSPYYERDLSIKLILTKHYIYGKGPFCKVNLIKPQGNIKLSWNALKHFWQIHLTVALCTAVATGVLAGALIVGDSVRGSLRNLTTERLGAIQHALLADHFFQPDLLQRQHKVPAILLNGTIVAPQTQARASKVNITGVTEDFFTLWQADTPPNLNKPAEQPFNAIVINEALQNELNVQIGDTLLVNMSQAADIHPEFLLGERDVANAIQSLRLVISDIIPTKNAGRFSLQAHQSLAVQRFYRTPRTTKSTRTSRQGECRIYYRYKHNFGSGSVANP